jgi:hypothetical protein
MAVKLLMLRKKLGYLRTGNGRADSQAGDDAGETHVD